MPLPPGAQERLNLVNAISIAKAGYERWAAKPHNKKWVRKLDGTPIPNDIVVCIAEEIIRSQHGDDANVAIDGVRVFEHEQPE